MTYDMRDAISKIDNIPLVKESIPELTKLANGFDPSIPGYLALGRLYQITNLAKSAKAAEPPQGTIKDKTTQAAGLMALMGGRGQMAAQNSATQTMRQPGPVPQNTPEPEMQAEVNPEEMMGMEMGMADGGITSMDIDPRMFNFDGGGIVTFANPEKEKKQQVKEKDKDDEYSDEPLNMSKGPKRANPLSALAELISKAIARPQKPSMMLDTAEAPNMAEAPPVAPPEVPVVPVAPPQVQPAPPAPPKPPMGGINDGKTSVPGANINIGTAAPQAMPENKFLTATEGFINQKPEVFNEATETAKINARNEAAGIGTYAKVMREQQQGMRDQFERSRPTMNEDIVGLLRRYSRPGAMAGDVGDEANTQMRTEREARMQFAQDQFKVTEAIERLEEARRTGNVDKIAAAETALKKANIDLRNHQMTAAASAASVVSADQRSAADRAQNLQIENAKLQIETAKLQIEKGKLAQLGRDPEAIRILKQVEALEAQGKTKEALALIEKLGRIHAAMSGARYTGKSTAPTETQIMNAIRDQHRLENQMNFVTLGKKNAKPAEKAAAQAAIDATEKRVRAGMTRGTVDADGDGGTITPDQRAAAEQWLKDNPNDPKAAQIRQRLAGG